MDQSADGVLRYQLRFVHYWLFHCVHQFLSPSTQAVYAVFALAAGHALWTLGLGWPAILLLSAVAYGLMWLLQWLFNAIYLTSRRNRVLTEHVVQMGPQGLTDRTATYETLNRWPGVLRVRSYPGLVAVYIGPFEAVIVPKTAFASPEARARWVAQVQQQLRAAV